MQTSPAAEHRLPWVVGMVPYGAQPTGLLHPLPICKGLRDWFQPFSLQSPQRSHLDSMAEGTMKTHIVNISSLVRPELQNGKRRLSGWLFQGFGGHLPRAV